LTDVFVAAYSSVQVERMDKPPAQPRATRLLLVDADAAQLETMSRTLRPVATEIDTRTAIGEVPDDGAYDVIAANYDELTADERGSLVGRFSSADSRTRLLLISAGRCQGDFATLFGSRTLTNLLAKNGEVDAEDLIVTVQKILKREIFGLEKYFIWGVDPVTRKLTRASQKQELLDEAEAYARGIGVHPRLATQFKTVADELMTNAVYNAPRDAAGNSRWGHVARVDEVELGPGEEIEVKFCSDGRRLGIAASDPFGSLTQERLLDYLAKCFRRGDDQIDQKAGGAGLGFYYIFDAVSHLVANIATGRRTEMIGLIDIRGSYRDFAQRRKSFNIFHE